MFNWKRSSKSEDRVTELLAENEALKTENALLKKELESLKSCEVVGQDEPAHESNDITHNAPPQDVPPQVVDNSRPELYDDNYVDTVATFKAAKDAGLNMHAVQEGLDEADRDWDKVFAWKEFVYNEIRKVNPEFVDYSALRKRLINLDSWSTELSNGLDDARDNGTLKSWEVVALNALEVAKKTAKERYS